MKAVIIAVIWEREDGALSVMNVGGGLKGRVKKE